MNSAENQLNIQISKAFNLANMAAEIGGGIQYTDERLGWTAFDFFIPSYTTARVFSQSNRSK